MGALVVLASHKGDEILGAARAMADALARGERVGIVMLAESCPADIVQGAAPSTRVEGAIACQAALKQLLGEVPPLLMLSHPAQDPDMQGQPDLGETSMLGGFLHSICASTLLVTDPGYRDAPYKAALRLALRIMAQGLAERLVIVSADGSACGKFAGGARTDDSRAAEICDILPHIIRCQHDDPNAFATSEMAWWDFTVSADQAAHYSRIVAALADRWYPAILELGCGNGTLTPVLAAHSHQLVTFDASQAALDGARMRVGGAFNVELCKGALPRDLPAGSFDLIVLNDCLGSLGLDEVAGLAQRLPALCNDGGRIILANRLCGAADALATELLIGELTGWIIVYSGDRKAPQILVLERG